MLKRLLLMAAFAAAGEAQIPKLLLFGGPSHDVFLGCLNCSSFSSDSIQNSFGKYGSSFSADSIFNSFGRFGNAFSGQSPCNQFSTDAPVIVDPNGGYYGRLTLNAYHPKLGIGESLMPWLKDVCDGKGEGKQAPVKEAGVDYGALLAEVERRTTTLPSAPQYLSGTPLIGITIDEVDPKTAKKMNFLSGFGVKIRGVDSSGPGSAAGLKKNDVIMRYDKTPIQGTTHFGQLLLGSKVGDLVILEIFRDGKTLSASVVLAERR